MNLFLFSMIVLVLADNYLFSFLGWEGVGFCSYGLVGFWFERDSAAVAAKKAFVTNRVGDFGFMIALFLMFGHFHSFNYSTVLAPLAAGHATLASAPPPGSALHAVPRRGGQVGPDPAVHVAARRHGGPHPGVGPHPRRHHGHRRRVPDGPQRARSSTSAPRPSG